MWTWIGKFEKTDNFEPQIIEQQFYASSIFYDCVEERLFYLYILIKCLDFARLNN